MPASTTDTIPAGNSPTASRALVATPPPPRARRAEVRTLTGLRGIAALLVAVYHIDPELRRFDAFGRIVGRGYLWVDVFFVLSGFVLALNYGAQFRPGWRGETWRGFLLRRIARVYPLYAVLLFASLAYMAMGVAQAYVVPLLPYPHLAHPLRIEIANVFMVQSWGFGPSIDGTAWSLSAEAAAYVLFPFLAAWALFSRRRTALAVALAAAAAVIAVAMLTRIDGEVHSGALDAYDGATVEPVLRCLGGFVLGLLMFRLAQAGRVGAFFARNDVLAAVVGLLVIGFAYAPNDLWIYPLVPLLVLGLYGNRGAIGRALGSGPIHWLGVISYSIYLVHPYLVLPKRALAQLLGGALGPVTADAIASAAAFAAALTLSAASYRLIEEPGRRALNRAARAWTQRAAAQRG
jgi:peptidoglycan/LPS O-acetylase OafA/YrhL